MGVAQAVSAKAETQAIRTNDILISLPSIYAGTKVSVRLCRPTVGRQCQLRSGLSVTQWHQLVDARDLVVCVAVDAVGEPCLRINAVQLGGFDQRIWQSFTLGGPPE